MNLSVRPTADPMEDREVELVERKGVGHPDSISDGLAESVSRALSKEYRERTGRIFHHNTDEVQLVAGSSSPGFGGGETDQPIYILLTGRATKKFEAETIPVERIALESAREYIEENFKFLSPEHIEFDSRIGETSTDLKDVYDRKIPVSNDTSFGVGHAPYSDTEKVVRKLENELLEIDPVGEDIKVMGLRNEGKLQLTVASAMIDSRIKDLQEYRNAVEEVRQKSRQFGEKVTGLETEVNVNTADSYEDDSVYLTVTGTSAEMGDDGSVGRGNRVNGLITPHRSMSMEAASGKNPVTHVGKIYNLLSQQIARQVHSETGKFAQVKILSEIGSRIDQPKKVEVETQVGKEEVQQTVQRNLDEIEKITEKVLDEEVSTF